MIIRTLLIAVVTLLSYHMFNITDSFVLGFLTFITFLPFAIGIGYIYEIHKIK